MSPFLLIFTGGHQVNEMGMLDNPIFFLSKALDQGLCEWQIHTQVQTSLDGGDEEISVNRN